MTEPIRLRHLHMLYNQSIQIQFDNLFSTVSNLITLLIKILNKWNEHIPLYLIPLKWWNCTDFTTF